MEIFIGVLYILGFVIGIYILLEKLYETVLETFFPNKYLKLLENKFMKVLKNNNIRSLMIFGRNPDSKNLIKARTEINRAIKAVKIMESRADNVDSEE